MRTTNARRATAARDVRAALNITDGYQVLPNDVNDGGRRDGVCSTRSRPEERDNLTSVSTRVTLVAR